MRQFFNFQQIINTSFKSFRFFSKRKKYLGIRSLQAIIDQQQQNFLFQQLSDAFLKKQQLSLLQFYKLLDKFYNDASQQQKTNVDTQNLKYILSQIKIRTLLKNNKNMLERKFQEIFLKKILPMNCTNQLKQIYAEQLSNYLKKEQTIEFNTYFSVLENWKIMILRTQSDIEQNQGINQSENIIKAFQIFLTKYTENIRIFDSHSKIKMVKISKYLRVHNHYFAENLKFLIQLNNYSFSLSDLLLIFAYLVDVKAVPYEFFYYHHQQWYRLLSDRNQIVQNQSNLLRVFEILSKQRWIYTQRLLQMCIKQLQEQMHFLDQFRLIRILYYYSKTKYQKTEFLSKVLNLIQKYISILNERNMKYLLMGLAYLNYNEIIFIRKISQNPYMLQTIQQLKNQNFNDYCIQILKVINQPQQN